MAPMPKVPTTPAARAASVFLLLEPARQKCLRRSLRDMPMPLSVTHTCWGFDIDINTRREFVTQMLPLQYGIERVLYILSQQRERRRINLCRKHFDHSTDFDGKRNALR